MNTYHTKLIMYSWPYSQECMECKHGKFLVSDQFEFTNSDYICEIEYTGNDGVNCKKRETSGERKNTDYR